MKVRCLFNSGRELRQSLGVRENSQLLSILGISDSTDYGSLTINKEYFVMGVLFEPEQIRYLIQESTSSHGSTHALYPSVLFEVTDARMPSNWFFTKISKPYISNGFLIEAESIVGYFDLCFDKKHLGLLIDWDDDARQIFYQRYQETKQELEHNA